MINLTPEELATVKGILAKEVPNYVVWAFGSRVKGGAKSYSDLDVVIVGKERVPRNKMAILKEAFQTSKLSVRIEVLDWHRIPPHFKKIIESQREMLQSLPEQGPS